MQKWFHILRECIIEHKKEHFFSSETMEWVIGVVLVFGLVVYFLNWQNRAEEKSDAKDNE